MNRTTDSNPRLRRAEPRASSLRCSWDPQSTRSRNRAPEVAARERSRAPGFDSIRCSDKEMGSAAPHRESEGFTSQERDPERVERRRIANPKDSPARSAIPKGVERRRQVNPEDSPASGLPRRHRGDIARHLGRCRPYRRWNRSSTRSNRKGSSRSEFRYREDRTPVGSPGCRSGSGGPRIRPHREARRLPKERDGEVDKQRPAKSPPPEQRPESNAKSGALRRLHQKARRNPLPATD